MRMVQLQDEALPIMLGAIDAGAAAHRGHAPYRGASGGGVAFPSLLLRLAVALVIYNFHTGSYSWRVNPATFNPNPSHTVQPLLSPSAADVQSICSFDNEVLQSLPLP